MKSEKRITSGYGISTQSRQAPGLARKVVQSTQPSVYGDELLTDKEVSQLLKVSRRTLQDYRNNGILPYTQVGGKVLYRSSDIERTLMEGYREAYRSRT